MKFTEAQKKAIYSTGGDMLVSAGAGSGKTTVLTNRLIDRIEKGAELKDFLVATFTNSAAADLKAKLAKRLDALCAADNGNKRYIRQLYSLPAADIGTIDSFCLQYVKQYATVLELGGTSVGDEALCAALLWDSAESVLNTMCEDDDPAVDILLDNFASHKSDDGLLSATVQLYGKLRAYPFYREWIEGKTKAYGEEAADFSKGSFSFFDLPHGHLVQLFLYDCTKPLVAWCNTLYDLAEDDTQYSFADKVAAAVMPIVDGVQKGYGEFCAALAESPALRRPKGCGDEYVKVYTNITDRRKKLKEYLRSEEELKAEYEMTGTVLNALCSFMLKLDDAYTAEKARRGIIDFADGEQCFLNLLVTKTKDGLVRTSLCKELSAAYKEVFIDEYQDISPLQDMIFALIGSGKRFMVGDVKQSIYGFRNAYPDIFVAYSEAFKEDGNGAGLKVLLKENFRCNGNIIEFCNYVFGKIYTEESAGTDYSTEALVHGKEDDGGEKVKVNIYENAEDDSSELNDTVREVIGLIKAGRNPKDIAILCRKASVLRRYANALAALGVPTNLTVGKEELLKQPEVLLATSALRVIDNPTDDISLAALLRSPIYGFTAAELAEIRRGGTSLFDDLRHTAMGIRQKNACFRLKPYPVAYIKLKQKPLLKKGGSTELSTKCEAFLKELTVYRTKALFLPVHKLLWFVYEQSNIMSFAPADRADNYKANLLAFYRLAMGMENTGYKGVSVFTDYLGRLAETGSSPAAEKSSAAEGVQLMTIHGSKGLEFPVVFVVGCGNALRGADRTGPITVNYNSGISLKLKRQKEALSINTLLRQAELAAEDRRSLAEELRILYVAFTRAVEQLYISASFPQSLEERLYKEKQGTYADLFVSAVALNSKMFYNVRVTDVLQKEVSVPTRLVMKAEGGADLPLKRIFPTPKTKKGGAAKFSASVLQKGANGKLVTRTEALVTERVPAFSAKEQPSAASRGTANHLFMQFADFNRAEADVPAEADRLLEAGYITAEQRSIMDLRALADFFTSPLYEEMKTSPRLYREKRFTTRVSEDLFEKQEGEAPLLQGVIDCFYENSEGGFTLVDYKSDTVRQGDEQLLIERHGVQLGLYRLYIEKVTGKKVTKAYIYSFALGKAIDCGNPAEL